MQGAPAFALEGVDVLFGGTRALSGVSLGIHPGEAVAIVGPSGSGKTTLLRLFNGSVRPSAGRVLVRGRALTEMSAGELQQTRTGIGVIHQDLCLVPTVRVVQNVIAGRFGQMSLLSSLRATLLPSRAEQHEIYDILERVGISEKLHERTDRLSGGQRQRVAIARALFQRPTALLADEPVSSVDPARARDAVQLLVDICRQAGLTLCVSLHNLDIAREFFPRLVGLRGGRLLFDEPTAGLEASRFASLYRLTAEDAPPDDPRA